MAYLICFAVPFFYLTKAISMASLEDENRRTSIPLHNLLAMVPGLVLASGFMIGIFPSASFRPNHDINYSPYLVLIGGVLAVLAYGFAAFQKRVDAQGVVRQGGAWILAALASAYLTFTAVDHFIFFADKESAGIMASEMLNGNSEGVRCDAPYLIARKADRAFVYRCRGNLQLGHQFGEPFIPWPSYTEGRSEHLMSEFERLSAEADKATGTLAK